jgi:hypothetical protein
MASFRDIDDAARSEREAIEAKRKADEIARVEREQQNLRDGEEWLRRIPLAILKRAQEELAGRYSLEFSEDLSRTSPVSSGLPTICYTLEPIGGSRYRALPHYVFADKQRNVKCIAYSMYDDRGAREVFWGNIDTATEADFEKHISDLVRWWVNNR